MGLTKIEKHVKRDYLNFRLTMGIKASKESAAKKNNLSMIEIDKLLGFK